MFPESQCSKLLTQVKPKLSAKEQGVSCCLHREPAMTVVHGEIMAAHIQVSNLVLHPSLEGTQKAVGTTRTRFHSDEAATCTGVWCVHR